jgi:hypothetical protein
MQVLALLIVTGALGQNAPADEPPRLKPGETVYYVELTDGTAFYGIRSGSRRDGGRLTYTLDDVESAGAKRSYDGDLVAKERPEDEASRASRWRDGVSAWHAERGNVRIERTDGTAVWVNAKEKEWAERAREQARVVAALHTAAPLAVSAPNETASVQDTGAGSNSSGFLTRWGPQIALVLCALVAIGLIAKRWVFTGESGWQKIE